MVDQEKVEAAIKLLLEGIGEDPTREGLLETPARVARMYGEIAGGMDQSAEEHLSKTFAVASNDLVIERDITFYSLCEHHLLPFYGKAAIGYIPNGRVAGLSKLARTVEVYARRLQLQEQLCAQVADALMDYLAPQGAIVLMEAEHMCMTMRGSYKVTSNLENGYGRSDITLESLHRKNPHVIIEFKQGTDLERLKNEALEQILEKKYYAPLKGEILCIGLAHDKKRCELACQRLQVPE